MKSPGPISVLSHPKIRDMIGHLKGGVPMSSITQFLKEGEFFDDATTKLIGEAFDAACKELHDRGQPALVREIIATRIIQAAKEGERDQARLREAGLSALPRR
jgi:hypothetical protein